MSRVPQFPIRFSDSSAYSWLWLQGPCSWSGKLSLNFREIEFGDLQPAGTMKHWDVLAHWTRQIARRRVIPPLIVSETEDGRYYIHDGNHRYEAIRVCYRRQLHRLRLRVAVLEPAPGYAFVHRWFGTYGTYCLLPEEGDRPSEADFDDAEVPPEDLLVGCEANP